MLKGILSGSLPPLLGPVPDSVGESSGGAFGSEGLVPYSAILSSKGRMITDLRVLALEDGSLLLDLPQEGFEGTLAHFRRTLPPRLATVEDLSEAWSRVTILGPHGAGHLEEVFSDLNGGAHLWPRGFEELREGEALVLRRGSAVEAWITPDGDLDALALDVVGPAAVTDEVLAGVAEQGATAVTEGILDLLRLERGRPKFGVDMDQRTIPVEAGIQGRAIDYEKGCYTGQEVIIRIRDLGQVNKHLRGFLLGNSPVPSPGSELFAPGVERGVGWITTAASSPAFQQTIALGYARRSVQPGDELRVGGPGGAVALTCALGDGGWAVDASGGPTRQ